MSDYSDEDADDFESLEEYQEEEDSEYHDEDEDWSDSLDDMESDDWSEQFNRGSMDLEELDHPEDFGDDEVDDIDLERLEQDYFDGEDYEGDESREQEEQDFAPLENLGPAGFLWLQEVARESSRSEEGMRAGNSSPSRPYLSAWPEGGQSET